MIAIAPAPVWWRLALALLGVATFAGAGAAAAEAQPLPATPAHNYPSPPQDLFDGLFVAVQAAGVYADGKTFADAIPMMAPPQILADYRRERPDTAEALRSFVAAHFRLPGEAATAPPAAAMPSITAHIDELWGQLTRETTTAPPWSSLLPLPRPYVVPGGRFREIYYWDSYFTMLGLIEAGREDLADDMVKDFAHLIDNYGHVPNGTRTYYLSRSQPPFFYLMVGLLDRADPTGLVCAFPAGAAPGTCLLDAGRCGDQGGRRQGTGGRHARWLSPQSLLGRSRQPAR